MKILAVDYGDARTGLAICDAGEMLASPVGVIHSHRMDEVVQKAAEAAREQRAERIVVGNPINMNGAPGVPGVSSVRSLPQSWEKRPVCRWCSGTNAAPLSPPSATSMPPIPGAKSARLWWMLWQRPLSWKAIWPGGRTIPNPDPR